MLEGNRNSCVMAADILKSTCWSHDLFDETATDQRRCWQVPKMCAATQDMFVRGRGGHEQRTLCSRAGMPSSTTFVGRQRQCRLDWSCQTGQISMWGLCVAGSCPRSSLLHLDGPTRSWSRLTCRLNPPVQRPGGPESDLRRSNSPTVSSAAMESSRSPCACFSQVVSQRQQIHTRIV